MKKLLASFLSVCLMTSILLVPAGAAVQTDGVFTLLKELNIMSGDPDGNLRLDDTVTRAEFTKMAVAASSHKNSVATHLTVSPFPDVTWRHWAAPYVRVGVSNNLVSGYPDATFRPDNTVLFEEGITIMLRVLGYGDADFGASWPYGQVGLANNLELTDGVGLTVGQTMNRAQVGRLIYNALATKLKGQNTQLASVFDMSITQNVTLISDGSDDSSIASNEVYTSAGTYQISNGYDRTLLGLEGDVAIKDGRKLLAFVPNEESQNQSERYVLYSVLPNAVMVYKNGALSQLTVKDNTPVYKGKNQSTFGAIKSSLALGDILRVKSSSYGIDSITCQTGEIQGPAVVSSAGWQMDWKTDSSTRVMRNGLLSSLDALESCDVVYFMPEMNLVLSYSDKVTGVYESASPNKDTPQSVTVSGKTYQIESGSAFTALASGGSFAYGDTVTLLLGKDGQVAGAVSPNATSNKSLVGYLLETGQKDFETGVTNSYSGYYVKVVFPDGTLGDYATDRSYSSYKNKVVTLSFQNGYARVHLVTDSNSASVYGTYNHETGKLGKHALLADAKILDIGTVDANASSVYCRIYPTRLDGVSLSNSQILYCSKNATGKIDTLILKDVTGDAFSYGLMLSAKQNNQQVSGNYSYMVDGKLYQLNTGSRLLNVPAGSAIKIAGNLSNPDSVSRMTELSGGVKLVNASELTHNKTTYPISGNVSVYQRSSSYDTAYVKIPITDILDKNDIQISAYCDDTPSSGGMVRVIVVY